MDKLKLVQQIGGEICEDCGEYRDCGLEYDDCGRIENALNLLDEYNQKIQPTLPAAD